MEQPTQRQTNLSLKERLEIGRLYLFQDMDYPIFNEEYRKDFETHFIRNFYMKNIGFETPSLFKMELETWLIINMPYFNNLFESELINFDPLVNTDLTIKDNKQQDDTRDYTSANDGTTAKDIADNGTLTSITDNTSSDDNFERRVYADVPDSRLQLTTNDGQGVLEYASNISEDNTNNINNFDGSVSNTNHSTTDFDQVDHSEMVTNTIAKRLEDGTHTKVGKIGVGSYSTMLKEYRSTFLRVEKQLFKEMSCLFLQIYL